MQMWKKLRFHEWKSPGGRARLNASLLSACYCLNSLSVCLPVCLPPFGYLFPISTLSIHLHKCELEMQIPVTTQVSTALEAFWGVLAIEL